jgi:hypothetical protein
MIEFAEQFGPCLAVVAVFAISDFCREDVLAKRVEKLEEVHLRMVLLIRSDASGATGG